MHEYHIQMLQKFFFNQQAVFNFYGSFAQAFSSGCLIRLSLPLQIKD
jgi:hypothetical protein